MSSSSVKRLKVDTHLLPLSPLARQLVLNNTNLLPEILKFLPVIDLMRARRVAREWNKKARPAFELQDASWGDFIDRFRFVYLLIKGLDPSLMQPLEIFNQAQKDPAIKTALAHYLRNLTRVQIDTRYIRGNMDGILTMVTELAPRLQTLCLQGMVTNDGLNGIRCTLKGLKGVPQLQELTAFHYNAPEGPIPDGFLEMVKSLRLTDFRLVHPGGPRILEQTLNTISNLKNLTSLVLPKEMSKFPEITPLFHLRLQRLFFSRISSFTDESFGNLLSALPDLCQLNIGSQGNPELSFQGMLNALCPQTPRKSPITAFACSYMQLGSTVDMTKKNATTLSQSLRLPSTATQRESYEYELTKFATVKFVQFCFGDTRITDPFE